MQRYALYLYLETALHVSGGTSTHHHNDGWRYHLKHVQQFPDINKLCNIASCWIYSRIPISGLQPSKSIILNSNLYQFLIEGKFTK